MNIKKKIEIQVFKLSELVSRSTRDYSSHRVQLHQTFPTRHRASHSLEVQPLRPQKHRLEMGRSRPATRVYRFQALELDTL